MSLQLVESSPMGLQCFPTSAGGTMWGRVYGWLIRVGGDLSVQGTTSMEGLAEQEQSLILQEQTNSGVCVQGHQSSSAAIMELRRLSGLTWDQLARLLDVTRRTLHFWASGKPLTPAHEERLHRLLATIRQLNRGSSTANRALLLGVHADGSIPFDLLVDEQYERVLSLLGPGGRPVRSHPSELSGGARLARVPLAPDELVGAIQDRVHKDIGKARTPRIIKGRQ